MARGGLVERAGFASAQCQHHTASWGALAISSCVLRASTCRLCRRRSARAAPSTCGAHVRPQQDSLFMLPYCQQFCNAFPASSPSVWQRVWATRRPLSPTSLAHIRRLLQMACRTPRRLSVRRLLLYVTRTPPPTQCSAARTWWTPRSVSLRDDYASGQCHQPVMAAAYRVAYLLETARVPTGDGPRTYWRRPAYLLET